jgi:hypothetical protein
MGHENETSHTFGSVSTTGAPDVAHVMGKGTPIGNIPVTEATVFVSIDHIAASTAVLALGKPGQRMTIVLTKMTGPGPLNVAFTDYAGVAKTLSFTLVGNLAELIFTGLGWQSVVLNGATVL